MDKNKKKYPNNKRDGFKREFSRRDETPRAPAKRDILGLKDGDYYIGTVKILRRAVPGPVIFLLSDGFGAIDGVIKESKFDIDNIVSVSGMVNERAGRLQLEIKNIEKTDMDFEKIIEEHSVPVRTTFSIKSERYEKMKPRFIQIAQRIRKAIMDNQPILIRHHNDSDGINAGIAIETACRILMEKIGINPEYNLYRSPSQAPFYDTSDMFRDLVMSKRLTEEHDQKKPLILILDTGSTPESIFSFKVVKSTGHECIVIDHHNPITVEKGKTLVDPYISMHLNPYIFGFDSQTCAGMLCYEMARFINEEFENPSMPAVAAITDRCIIPETLEYIKNSKRSKEDLNKIGVAIDFLAYNLRFEGGRGLVEDVYLNFDLVKLLDDEVRKDVEKQLQSTMPYLRTQEINGVIFSAIDLEKYTLRFTYPTPGKVIGMIHDTVAEGKEKQAVLTIGHLSDMILIRATKPVLPVQRIIQILKKEMPTANVDGGGHEMAGTIKFVPAHLTAIIERIKEELKKINYAEKEA